MICRQLLCIFLVFNSFATFSQDSSKFEKGVFGLISFGREIGDLTESPNEIYLQTMFGYKFSDDFGVAAGPSIIHYDNYTFLPLITSVRKNASKPKKVGFLFELGYMIPLRGIGENFQVNYKITKGGSYFNPQITGLLFSESNFVVYMNLGYRVYSFTQVYHSGFSFQNEVEERVTARFINIGLTLEIK